MRFLFPALRRALAPMAAATLMFAWAAAAADVVELAKSSGVQGGIIVHLGCGDGLQTAKLRLNERFLVHGLDSAAANVEAARRNISAGEPYGPVSASLFDGKHLPYVDNLVDLIVCEGETSVPREEILRALAPLGVALLGAEKVVKPWPAGMDEWTHYLHGADNNAVARDRLAGIPRSIQWVAEPRWGRSHEELASMSAAVTAQGRLYYIVDEAPLVSIRYTGQWKLVARDAFNGVLLWKKDISCWVDHLRHFRSGPVHLARRLVAAGERLYVTLGLGAPVTALDGATGKGLRVYTGSENTEEILCDNGVLYLVAGTSEANRRGEGLFKRNEPEPVAFRSLCAFQAESGRLLWKKSFGQDEFLLPETLAVSGRGLFYQSTTGVVRLDASTGTEMWHTPRRTPVRRMSFSAPTLVVADGVVLLADRDAAAKAAGAAPASGGVEWAVCGWDEPGFERHGKCTLRAYAANTGTELWSAPCTEGYNSPVDVFVRKDTVWVGADFQAYDVKTGESRGKLDWKGAPVGMLHHRCYRNKATEDYIFTGRSGVEVVSLETGWLCNNSWLRGTCQYGIMPANGLIYAPPNACACFGKVKTPGFFAAAPQRGKDGHMPFSTEPALQKGAAYEAGRPRAPAADDWPMYRHDASRSGVSATAVPVGLKRRWSSFVGGRLTQPVIAGESVFVASTDAHSVSAMGIQDGKTRWRYTAGGRIDSAPSLQDGRVFFGSADGWVYCLRAADGQLAWRFRAAPQERLVAAYGQLECVWPVHGAVLVQNGIVYATAGRSTYLDGGIVLYALDPASGREIARKVVSHLDPDTGKQVGKEGKGVGAFDMEGTTSDILSGDGESVFLKHLRFDKNCQPVAELKPHLFCVTGFLGEEWFVRSFWLLGDHAGAGWGNWANPTQSVPFGRILCADKDCVYGYGRVRIASGRTGHRLDAYHLYARDRAAAPNSPVRPRAAKAQKAGAGEGAKKEDGVPPLPAPKWSEPDSLVVRAMALAGDNLLVAGPPDLGQKRTDILAFSNEAEALAAFEGKKGVLLRVVSAKDGSRRSETALTSMPVFDGLSAAQAMVFVALQDGTVECWAAK